MNLKLNWLITPLAVVALVACGAEEGDDTTDSEVSTGGTTTTETGVEISLGSGTGSSFNVGVMSAGTGSTALSAGGTTSVTVNVVDSNNSNALYSGVPVDVVFDSRCIREGTASFSADENTVVTSSGIASTTYQAEGCYGDDTISATVGDATASVKISVSPADVNSIGFVSSSAVSISYTNSATGAQPNIAKLEFALIDERGNPVQGQEVAFSISSGEGAAAGAAPIVGDVTLSNDTDISDSSGLVSTQLNAGTAPANVRVSATFTPITGDPISTQSLPIAINTGPAVWNNLGTVFGPERYIVPRAGSQFNIPEKITVRLQDRNNNPVAAGTVVSFWAEAGSIPATCLTNETGGCTVTWLSGGGEQNDFGRGDDDGRTTILAYTVGEDAFFDILPQNGIFDNSEPKSIAPEPFQDRDGNGVYDAATEGYIDYNGNLAYDDGSAAKYRGSLCAADALANGHCAEKSALVWADFELVMATDFYTIGITDLEWTDGEINTVTVLDKNNNCPPVGGKLTVTADAVKLTAVGSTEVLYEGHKQDSACPVFKFEVEENDDATDVSGIEATFEVDGIKSGYEGTAKAGKF